ncbi:MAG TPA: hypothetical protein P5080_03410 [Candidatus Paceibacterota bacterium]|nr:hypothetical protein [Candidatus Pacearchaeota archaeon]HRZ51013.1 hypothetical protein [Candidatus Paceibacterota bacterium]HSA36734.1 hypothetical protein [Candidatus Paceibacterota bacterium]
MKMACGKKKNPIPELKFFITEALGPDAGIEEIKLSHENCGGGKARISLAKKEEFIIHQSYYGEILETSFGVPLPPDFMSRVVGDYRKRYLVGNEPVLTITCACGFNTNLILANGGREALVNLARWATEKPNAIIVSSADLPSFYGGEVFFGRMKDGKVF